MSSEQILYAGIAGCITAIVHLYFRLEKKSRHTEERLQACEQDRVELWKRLAEK